MFAPIADLQASFNAASPRRHPTATPAASLLIHGGILLLWLGLLARAWFPGLLGWSAGMVYVTYDTALLAFTAWQTFRLTRAPAPAPSPTPNTGRRPAHRADRPDAPDRPRRHHPHRR